MQSRLGTSHNDTLERFVSALALWARASARASHKRKHTHRQCARLAHTWRRQRRRRGEFPRESRRGNFFTATDAEEPYGALGQTRLGAARSS